MFKDLIKFTAKITIVAVIFVYVIAPRIPGMPKIGDLLHLPSLDSVAHLVLDPADLYGKSQHFDEWLNSKLPRSVFGLPVAQIHTTPPGLDTHKSVEDNAKDVLDPGGLFHTR